MEITILSEREIRECVQLDEIAIDAVSEGFTKLSDGEVTLPPIMRIDVPENHREVDVKRRFEEILV